jgi:subtilisin family serine protease
VETPFSTSAEGTTGRALVLLERGAEDAAPDEIRRTIGVRVTETRAAPDGLIAAEKLQRSGGLLFSELGVAVVEADADRLDALSSEAAGVVAVEPERIVCAVEDATLPAEVDESSATWGLQAVGATTSPVSGSGVAVAVLDTGMDLEHPDFDGRSVVSQSFVEGQEAQDGNGHGTHCIGTACGPLQPAEGPRYGVAPGARIHAGKVLSDGGSGSDASILAGIEWAIRSGCRVISMSLGARVEPGQEHSQVFETVARRALGQNALVVAAAGNDSRRAQGVVVPVSHPANCPSILSVGALDVRLQVADFSNRGIDQRGGQLDFAAPGVDVHSSWLMPRRHRRISGTSMATPHVAGVLALLAEANPDARADELVAQAFKGARRMEHPSHDVGAGLIQAPSP